MLTLVWFYHLIAIVLDQCVLGQLVAKTTGLATNLALDHLDGLECNHPGQHKDVCIDNSGDLSRWAWGLNINIARALGSYWPKELIAITAASGADEAMGHASVPEAITERPQTRPVHGVFLDPEIVRSGFKSRPIRDGGESLPWGDLHHSSDQGTRLRHWAPHS